MIKITNINTYNFENAFRGLRNPMDSWSKSDSFFVKDKAFLGDNDKALAQRMIAAGTDESKFLRQIFVSMDIDAPLYWWKEMDQYRIGCTTNSTSTMHRLSKTPINEKCFSFEDSIFENEEWQEIRNRVINECEMLRQQYEKTKDKRYWRALIQLLPSAWNQKRTWTANYQVLRAIYFSRKNHKLEEWRVFCHMLESLPLSKELICYEKELKHESIKKDN